MDNKRIQTQHITIILLTITLVVMGLWYGSTALLFVTLLINVLNDLMKWFMDQQIWLAIRSRFYQKQVIAFSKWLNENADGQSLDMDFTDAPELPEDLREYWMRTGSLLQFSRLMKRQQEEQELAERKKKNKRGNRGNTKLH